MSALFSPITLRGLTLPNRIMVAPMCQYSAVDGEANDWHFTHINTLALSGAAMFCIEATHVEAIGRITPGCLGLWNDATEAALKPILASVRKHSKTAVAMQLAHAGRKGSSHTPWDGGQQIPLAQGGWQTEAPSAVPHKDGEAAPLALDAQGLARVRDAFVSAAQRAERLGIDAIELHFAHGYLLHQFLSPIANKRTDQYGGSLQNRLRYPLEVFDAVRVGVSGQQARRRQGFRDRLGRGRLGPRADHRTSQRVEAARRRLDRRVFRRRVAAAEDSARPRLSGAVRARPQGSDGRHHHGGRPDHRSHSRPRTSSRPARPTWSRWRAACSTTRAGAGTPPPNSAARSRLPPQYWRSQPSTQKALFGATSFGTR